MPLALIIGNEDHVYEKYFEVTHDTTLLPKADLVVFPGGADWNPHYYGKKPHPTTSAYRFVDELQMSVARDAVRLRKKLAGHCRGAQLLCILNGDQLIQNVSHHHGSHDIETHTGKSLLVNSIHHQMMAPRNNFKLLAWSKGNRSDQYETTDPIGNVIDAGHAMLDSLSIPREPEAVYFNNIKGLAAQWHPEWMREDSDGYQYYQELIQEYLL